MHILTEDCFMHEYAANQYEHYQPQDGCGYYHIKSEELKSIKSHKKLILMNEVQYKYAITFGPVLCVIYKLTYI